MQQIFIFGSSSVYGVGSTFGGRAGLIKNKLHNLMFGENGTGEKMEVFNFGKSGATIDYVQNTFQKNLHNYKRNGKIIVFINVGGNNSKAENEPDNYVSSFEEYQTEIENLLSSMKEQVDEIIFVSSGYVDENKTTPKPNPLTGGCSYFLNSRKKIFNKITQDVCKKLSIKYIGVDLTEDEWIDGSYIYKDGLHSSDKGHKYLFDKIWLELKNMLDI